LWAEIYDTESNPLIALEEARYPRELVEHYVKNEIVVDIGCGTGRNIKRMISFNAKQVIGLDISPGMLEKAKARFQDEPRVDLRLDNLQGEFKDVKEESVNAVTACLMLEHIKLNALELLFKEMVRVLKPGGCVMVTEMHPWLWELGGQAQFTDKKGTHIIVRSYRKSVADYLTAALEAGLRLMAITEQIMDLEVAKTSMRAEAFANQPMLLWYLLEKPKLDDDDDATTTTTSTTATSTTTTTTTVDTSTADSSVICPAAISATDGVQ